MRVVYRKPKSKIEEEQILDTMIKINPHLKILINTMELKTPKNKKYANK